MFMAGRKKKPFPLFVNCIKNDKGQKHGQNGKTVRDLSIEYWILRWHRKSQQLHRQMAEWANNEMKLWMNEFDRKLRSKRWTKNDDDYNGKNNAILFMEGLTEDPSGKLQVEGQTDIFLNYMRDRL